ncbi:MAG: orotidine-5'-phosphate decarboxylase [Myxococcaceae bacterium]
MAFRDAIAFAADVPLEEGVRLYEEIATDVAVAKVGLSLFVEHGPKAVERFLQVGARVFLDLKLHDIPNTVELAASRAGALGVSFLTIHACGGQAMMRAALEGARQGASRAGHPTPRILAVTVLTSFAEADLTSIGVPGPVLSQVERLAASAAGCGIDGLVCSAKEAAALRKKFPALFLCTPGIRPEGVASHDQSRAETPAAAIRAGADLLVIGRPLYQAPSPKRAAQDIAAEVAQAIASR